MSDEVTVYRYDYPNEPIGGGNPYYRCSCCGRSDPEINGRIDGHYEDCSWRIEQERYQPKIIECPKCGAKAAAFICDTKGCPVNGGAAH